MQAAVKKLKASLTKLKDAKEAGESPGPDLLRHVADCCTAAADCCDRAKPKTAAAAGTTDAAFEECAGIVDELHPGGGLAAFDAASPAPEGAGEAANVAGQPVGDHAPVGAVDWAAVLQIVQLVWSVVEQYRRK
jgi:hypothetical protein